MSAMIVEVLNVEVLNNPSPVGSPIQFQISFECSQAGLKEDIEWQMIHTVQTEGSSVETELDAILVGPVMVGKNKFIFEVPPPDIRTIPRHELLDLTGLVLVGKYNDQTFIRVGYYTRVEFPFELPLDEQQHPVLPTTIDYDQLIRNIASDKPRVTRYIIPWDDDVDDVVKIEQLGLDECEKGLEQDDGRMDDVFMGDYEEDDDETDEEEMDLEIHDF